MATSYPQRAFRLPENATELILVRHGASAPVVEGESFPMADGLGDPPLAPEGRVQAVAVAARLAARRPDGLFVSGLRRTVETARPLAGALELDPVTVPELREVFAGEWEGGELRVRMAKRDPLAMQVLREERWDVIPGAESMEALAGRVRAGVERVVAETGLGRVAVVVIHGGVIGEICRQATNSRPFAFVHSDNASISRLVVFDHGLQLLRSFNDVAHLEP